MQSKKRILSIRFLSRSMRGFRLFIKLISSPRDIRRVIGLIKTFGIRGFLGKTKRKITRFYSQTELLPENQSERLDPIVDEQDLPTKLSVRPFYLDPYFKLENSKIIRSKVAIHVHLHSVVGIEYITRHLNNMPIEYDIFVSVSKTAEEKFVSSYLKSNLEKVNNIKVSKVQNRGRNISHLLITFKRELANYDIVGHFHFKTSPHLDEGVVSVWMNQIFSSILGSPENIQQVLEILETDGCFVYAHTTRLRSWDESGWSDNYEVAQDFLLNRELFDIDNFKDIEFPKGFMFWSNVDSLKPLFDLDLQFEELPEEPLPEDGTLLHALERLLLLLISKKEKHLYRIESADYLDLSSSSEYEEQFDYRALLKNDKPKVLAYYLPQFHPIPENDAWHGAGFTEWNKVRTANPKFAGHYQQHIPHEDIGYYDLTSNEILKLQTQIMNSSGVYGMVFYHYWFKGKMVLEDVAERLLEDTTIQMPFSFCWANENWTRRWDGDDNDILLKQEYSKTDAVNFIRYLIPFFKDSRYIKVEGRPVIFIYRTISTANWDEYLKLWEAECESEGIKKPYVVATLTRGAQNASESGMDASVERVLQDWTNGNVSELNESLSFYEKFGGSVLSYPDVANYYQTKEMPTEEESGEPIFRSLVPNWDNTSRYDSSAYVLHDSSPKAFQSWLSEIIEKDKVTNGFEKDTRFVVVNAWNEWAEGAHLEPDKKHGYAYLNSIGRALSDIDYDDIQHIRFDKVFQIKLTFSELASSELKSMNYFAKRFIRSLASSQISRNLKLIIDDKDLRHTIKNNSNLEIVDSDEYEYQLHFESLLIFQPTDIDNLFKFSIRNPNYAICGNTLNEPTLTYGENNCVPYTMRGNLQLIPKGVIQGWKVSPSTRVFNCKVNQFQPASMPKINVIVRFHAKGDTASLFDCLKSLYSQADVEVVVHLCLQDLPIIQFEELWKKIGIDFTSEHFQIVAHKYISSSSNPDLRSLMLNETLKKIAKGYLLILDYDDILFSDALRTLARRLEQTGKAVTFGKIYSSTVDPSGKVVSRSLVYNWGRTYEDFFDNNISPIHGFLINLDRIDTDKIRFNTDQKYMEDYFLTLQIFTQESVDWESLLNEVFVGDYNHRISSHSQNTLAILDEKKREELLVDVEYLKCQSYIDELRLELARSNRSGL